jgi:hypothetical protein
MQITALASGDLEIATLGFSSIALAVQNALRGFESGPRSGRAVEVAQPITTLV